MQYERPEMLIVMFEGTDVIRTSLDNVVEDPDEEIEFGW